MLHNVLMNFFSPIPGISVLQLRCVKCYKVNNGAVFNPYVQPEAAIGIMRYPLDTGRIIIINLILTLML